MNYRRFLTAGLALALTASLAVLPAGAANRTPSLSEASQTVNALGIIVGDGQGNFNLGQSVTRAEFITMTIKATPNGDQVGHASTSPYPDVPYTHWAAGYVEAGVNAGLISGYSDGTFRPGNQITLAEGVTILLSLLGYTPQDFSGAYPTPQMAMYHSLGLDLGVQAQNPNTPLTRHDTVYLFYNLLSAKTKSGSPYLTTLGYSLNAAGEVDLVSILNGSMEGPVVASGNWQSSIPFPVAQASVTRDGKSASPNSIQPNDVLYWNPSMKTIWAYSTQVVGTIQELTPSASSPTAVKVAGRTYPIETSTAAFALSNLGQYGVGDTVTLLLGRDGGVAAVAQPTQSATHHMGVVTQVQPGQFSDGHNGTYSADTVTILATDGSTYSYEWETNYFKAGDLVEVSLSGNGEVSLQRMKQTSISGTVSADGTKLGSTPFASNVEILDVYEKTGVRVYPSRLSGVSIQNNMVSYYSKNSQGEIDQLILKDVTGDMHHYGVLTDVSVSGMSGLGESYSYTFDLGGIPGAIPMTSTRYPVEKGPIMIKGDVSAPDKMYTLTSIQADQMQGNELLAGNQRYPMSEEVAIYEYRDGKYYLSSAERVQEKKLELTGWYDKAPKDGGCIRVVVAK